MQVNAAWVMQMKEELPKTLLENRKVEERHIASRFPGCKVRADELERYIHGSAHIFFEMDDWNRFLREGEFTFSFGSRFHGNVASLLMGIPALWVTHDSRTQELVEVFRLPYIEESKMKSIRSVDELIEKCDYTAFYSRYKYMFGEYIRFLEENGIAHR